MYCVLLTSYYFLLSLPLPLPLPLVRNRSSSSKAIQASAACSKSHSSPAVKDEPMAFDKPLEANSSTSSQANFDSELALPYCFEIARALIFEANKPAILGFGCCFEGINLMDCNSAMTPC